MEFNVHYGEIARVVYAIFLGGLIGLEREIADKPAGLRTHMLVTGASTLLVILGDFLVQNFANSPFVDVIRADPIRIIEAIITGISFLGAGTIIFRTHREDVEGLTTAASILFAAAIGITVAINQLTLALILTIVVIVILFVLGYLEEKIKGLKKKLTYGKKNKDEE